MTHPAPAPRHALLAWFQEAAHDGTALDGPFGVPGGPGINWRRYVRREIRQAWPDLSLEARIVAWRVAEDAALDARERQDRSKFSRTPLRSVRKS